MRISFCANGARRSIEAPPLRRLLDILREDLRLTGTKEGCGEGECGACAVLLNGRLVNSCLVPALQLEGADVTTIEGLGSGDCLDPIQRAFVEEGAVQCGFCIPGMVLATRALLDGNSNPTREEIRAGLAGNLCRCTGYERILRAVEAAARERAHADGGKPPFANAPLLGATPRGPAAPDIASAGPAAGLPDEPLHRPATLAEAITLLRRHPEECTFVAGATDLLTMLKLGTAPRGPLIDIAGLPEISRIEPTGDVIEIGAAVTFSSILDDPLIARHLPALRAAASLFGAVAIRNRATLGGNLASASPAADAPPVLAALGAAVVLAGPEGAREVPIESFFLGYRSTARRPDEMLVRVRVPLPEEGTRQAFFKVGTRRAQAIAKVSLACRARLDQGGVLRNVRLAAGSVAPTVLALARTQAALEGKTLTPGLIREAALIASFEVSPIDDVRSTARYRSTVTGRLLARFLEELHKP